MGLDIIGIIPLYLAHHSSPPSSSSSSSSSSDSSLSDCFFISFILLFYSPNHNLSLISKRTPLSFPLASWALECAFRETCSF